MDNKPQKYFQEFWRDTYTMEIESIRSVDHLQKYAKDWSCDFAVRCPDHLEEIRAAYRKKMEELRS